MSEVAMETDAPNLTGAVVGAVAAGAFRATARIEAFDGNVYEIEFYAEDDWPLASSLSFGREEIDVTPPDAKWREVEGGRRFADLTLRGLVRVKRP